MTTQRNDPKPVDDDNSVTALDPGRVVDQGRTAGFLSALVTAAALFPILLEISSYPTASTWHLMFGAVFFQVSIALAVCWLTILVLIDLYLVFSGREFEKSDAGWQGSIFWVGAATVTFFAAAGTVITGVYTSFRYFDQQPTARGLILGAVAGGVILLVLITFFAVVARPDSSRLSPSRGARTGWRAYFFPSFKRQLLLVVVIALCVSGGMLYFVIRNAVGVAESTNPVGLQLQEVCDYLAQLDQSEISLDRIELRNTLRMCRK